MGRLTAFGVDLETDMVIDLLDLQWWQIVVGLVGVLGFSPAPWILGLATNKLQFTSTADANYASYDAGVTAWQERLKCPPSPAPGPAPAVARTVATCGDGSALDVYRVTGMGHVWPGASGGQLSWPDAPFTANDAIWAFFAAHPRIR